MFNTAIIKKKSKDKKNEASKVSPSGLKGIEDYDKGELKGADKAENKALKGADKVAPSKLEGSKKAKADDLMGIDLMMSAAKKKPKVDAYDKDKGYYDFSDDKKKINEKYLNKIKSRKGM